MKTVAFRLILGVFVSAVALYLAVRDIQWNAVLAAFGSVSPVYVAFALLSVSLNTLAKTSRWQVLLGARADKVRFGRLLSVLLAGQLINTLLPVRLGDLNRAYVIGGQGPGRAYTLGGVALEKVIDLLCMVLLIVVVFISSPLPTWLARTALVTFGLAMMLTVSVLIISVRGPYVVSLIDTLLHRVPTPYAIRLARIMHAGLQSLGVLHDPFSLLKVTGWSFLIWITAITTNISALQAFGVRLPISAAILLLIVLLAGVSVPNVGGVGIFEYLCMLSLNLYGVAPARALSFGIVLHAVTLLPMLLLGPAGLPGLGRAKPMPDTTLSN